MTFIEAKEKLHNYIEQADEKKIMEMLSLLEPQAQSDDMLYDDATLNMLRERSQAYLSGNSATYSLEESMERVKSSRKGNGI